MALAVASTFPISSTCTSVWCSSTRSSVRGRRHGPRDHVAEARAGHGQRDVGVHLLVGHLDVARFAAFALDDADDLEVVAADPQPFADAVLGGQ